MTDQLAFDYDPILDLDSGHPMGFLLYGNVTPDDVDLFLADEKCIEAFPDGADFNVTETYVRKVPATDENGYPCTRYAYSDQPGPGAQKALRVEEHQTWGFWCVNHIYEPAASGVTVESVLDPPWPKVLTHITPPERRRTHATRPQDGYPTVYLCWDCSRSFLQRQDAARAAELAKTRAEA